jgi:hypothetical protein
MQEINRLKQLRDQILGIEMHISLLHNDLIVIDRDIDFLKDLALVLNENIEVLKTDGIIAIATEYKKAMDELKVVNKNLEYYLDMKDTLTRESVRHIKMKEDSILEYEELKKRIDSQRVVLVFDQSKRKR